MITFVILVLVVYLLSVERTSSSELSNARAVRLKYLQEQLQLLYVRAKREQRSFLGQAISVSNHIKEEFPEYDWSSHTILLKRIAEPWKILESEPPLIHLERV